MQGAGGGAVDRQRAGKRPTMNCHWLNGLTQPVTAGLTSRRRRVLSVVKSAAGLRAISETGDLCRLAPVPASSTLTAADVSHPVIRGLYRQAVQQPAAAAETASSVSSSSSSL